MSLSHQTILELMSLADGELRGEDKARVEKFVAENDEARRIVETMRGGQVSVWLGPAMSERAAAAGADGIAESVMTAIQAGKVASLPKTRASNVRALRGAVAAGVAALALAAGIAVFVRSADKRENERAGVALATSTAPGSPSAVAAQQGRAPEGVEVNEIDAPSRGVSVFEIPAAAAAVTSARGSSVVVWVEDDPGSK